jgi:hypothetical protein
MGIACMRFYAVEDRLRDAITECRTRIRAEVAIDFTGTGIFVTVPESHILELEITSLREETGGTITWGKVVLDNETGSYCPRAFDTYRPDYNKYNGLAQQDGNGNLRPDRQIRISYTTGQDIPFVKRFLLYVDRNGFQQTATGYKGRVCGVGLVDLASRLKETDKEKDWTNPEVIVHSVICDKEFPSSSIVHQIAARAGLGVMDIDCSTVSEYLPYVRLTRSVWDELSDLARTYNAHLETALEKPLIFVNTEDEVQYTFDNTNTTHMRMYDLKSQYRNTLRFRWTRYREFAGKELWRYADPPVVYTGNLKPTYPFLLDGEKREIEQEGYSARYTVTTDEGKTLSVVYAENVDDLAAFTASMETDGPALTIGRYDVTTLRDRASIRLDTESNTVLLSARIHGDAIAGEANFSHYIDDPAEVAREGTVARNITTPYLSESLRDGSPYYRHYAAFLLARLKRPRKGFFLKTNRAVFNARVGAPVRVALSDGLASERAEIVQMELRYKAREAFVAAFFVEED